MFLIRNLIFKSKTEIIKVLEHTDASHRTASFQRNRAEINVNKAEGDKMTRPRENIRAHYWRPECLKGCCIDWIGWNQDGKTRHRCIPMHRIAAFKKNILEPQIQLNKKKLLNIRQRLETKPTLLQLSSSVSGEYFHIPFVGPDYSCCFLLCLV